MVIVNSEKLGGPLLVLFVTRPIRGCTMIPPTKSRNAAMWRIIIDRTLWTKQRLCLTRALRAIAARPRVREGAAEAGQGMCGQRR
jgi:hypothetical protein